MGAFFESFGDHLFFSPAAPKRAPKGSKHGAFSVMFEVANSHTVVQNRTFSALDVRPIPSHSSRPLSGPLRCHFGALLGSLFGPHFESFFGIDFRPFESDHVWDGSA